MQEHIYVYKGKNSFLNKQAITKKISSYDIDSFNIMHYDLLDNSSDDVLEELQTIAFFADLKIIVLKHIEEIDNYADSIFNTWEKYFKNPNPDVVLIIELDDNYEISKKVKDLIFSYAFVVEIEDMDKKDYPKFIEKVLKEEAYEMNQSAMLMLCDRTNYEFNLLMQELNKLKIYKIDEKIINEQDVLALVPRNLEDNIFELTNAMILNDHAKTIEIYEDLVTQNEDPLRIINFIANKMRELFHAKLLLQKGYTKNDLATHFGYSSGRTYYLMKNVSTQTLNQLESHMKKLSQLDYEIKSGIKNKRLGLELYLLGAS